MPNLTKDVGFLASFWPLYEYTYTGEVIEEESIDEASKMEVEELTKPANLNCDESDSNESGKSGFEFVEKNKDD